MSRPDVDRLSELRIETGVLGHLATTSLIIDDVDVLGIETPVVRRDGRRRPAEPFLPVDPMWLLPPDSKALLPTRAPTQAMIGVCSCGEPGCNSLWIQLRRTRDSVLWEPNPHSPRCSVGRSWRFGLVSYLNAVDSADSRPEERARLLARELCRQRDSFFGFPMGQQFRLLNARAWPGEDSLMITVADPGSVHAYPIPLGIDESDEDVLYRLRTFDPDLYDEDGVS
ncbi:MAG TPA: hypothetical protein VHX59_19540 [Mycobacteriales bacterium]|nr:hypothetical protein [Mycobacteriales bacterium]